MSSHCSNVNSQILQECVEADMDSEAVATLISKRARISRDCLMNSSGVYAELPVLCRGSPLAASLLGGLLALPTFVLSSYLGPRGFRSASDDVIIDWSKVNLTSWYQYESVEDVSWYLNNLFP
ncbi:hypothetical protein ACTXT7_012647 [Hymenolepis weldensis]